MAHREPVRVWFRVSSCIIGLACSLLFWGLVLVLFRFLGVPWGWMGLLAAGLLFGVWALARR